MCLDRLRGLAVLLLAVLVALTVGSTGAPSASAQPVSVQPVQPVQPVSATTVSAPLTSVSPFWFDVTSCSRIRSQTSSRTAQDVVRRLRLRGVSVVPTLTASGLDPARAIACLGTPASRDAHVRRILDLVRQGRYDGIDLDYEHLALTTNQPTARRVRAALTSFVGALCPRLSAQGKQCIVTVMARTGGVPARAGGQASGSDGVWQGALSLETYDYAALGAAATGCGSWPTTSTPAAAPPGRSRATRGSRASPATPPRRSPSPS